MMEKKDSVTAYVVCKLRAGEWRSKPSDCVGLKPKWSQQQVVLEFKEPTNIVYIEIRDKDKPAGKPMCQGQATVETFLNSGNSVVSVPMKYHGTEDVIGSLSFETFNNQVLVDEHNHSAEGEFPHIKPSCMVCKNTH